MKALSSVIYSAAGNGASGRRNISQLMKLIIIVLFLFLFRVGFFIF